MHGLLHNWNGKLYRFYRKGLFSLYLCGRVAYSLLFIYRCLVLRFNIMRAFDAFYWCKMSAKDSVCLKLLCVVGLWEPLVGWYLMETDSNIWSVQWCSTMFLSWWVLMKRMGMIINHSSTYYYLKQYFILMWSSFSFVAVSYRQCKWRGDFFSVAWSVCSQLCFLSCLGCFWIDLQLVNLYLISRSCSSCQLFMFLLDSWKQFMHVSPDSLCDVSFLGSCPWSCHNE